MTPLQTAAQAVIIAQCEVDAVWTTHPRVSAELTELRKALDAEMQQAVEPVAWLRTAESTKDTVWGAYGPTKVFDTDAPLFTRPAPPPPAGEQIDWQGMHLSEILAEKGITLQKTFVEKPRDHVGDATAMVDERDEFIQKLRDRIAYLYEIGVNDTPVLLEEAADMLEADAREIEGMECDYTDQVMRAIAAEEKLAQQVAVPQDVVAALDRMCTPLHESRLTGATAEADARSMKIIRDHVLAYTQMLAAALQPTQ